MSTYRVLFNLSYDHKYYRQGNTIELNELQAKLLLDHGALEPNIPAALPHEDSIETALSSKAA